MVHSQNIRKYCVELWCSVSPVRIKFLIDDTIPGEINGMLRDQNRIQNNLTTGEEKQHPGMQKENHSLHHMWSDF